MNARNILLLLGVTILVAVATVIVLNLLGVRNAGIYGGVAAGITAALLAQRVLRAPQA